MVSEFVAADCQDNAMHFSLGQVDIIEKFGIGYFFTFGDGVFGDREDGIGPFNVFRGNIGFASTLFQAGNSLEVDISQVAFSGPDRRVRRDYLAHVMVSITAAVVSTMGYC